MNKILQFARLDFLACKSSMVKISLLMAVIAVGLGLTQRSPEVVVAVISGYTMFVAIIPFTLTDKYHLDTLYSTLAIPRSTVVSGRYAFVFFCQLAAIVVGLVGAFIIVTFSGAAFDLNSLLSAAAGTQVILTLYMAVVLPFFFKYGPTKARLLMVIPFVGIAALSPFLKKLAANPLIADGLNGITTFLEHQGFLALLVSLLLMLLFHTVSAAVSDRIYAHKEL